MSLFRIREEYKLWLAESSGPWNSKAKLTPKKPEGRRTVDPKDVVANRARIKQDGLAALANSKKSKILRAYRKKHGGVPTGVGSRSYNPEKTTAGDGTARPEYQRTRSDPQVRGPEKRASLLTRIRKIFK